MDDFVKDILDLKPKNWGELAIAAKSLIGRYGEFEKQKRSVNFIYLGAKSASMENTGGDFSTEVSVIDRMLEIMKAGCVISNFVLGARTLVATQSLRKLQESGLHVTEVEDLAYNMVFDKSLELIQDMKDSSESLHPRCATILSIVNEELEVLPIKIRSIIADTLNFRPT